MQSSNFITKLFMNLINKDDFEFWTHGPRLGRPWFKR